MFIPDTSEKKLIESMFKNVFSGKNDPALNFCNRVLLFQPLYYSAQAKLPRAASCKRPKTKTIITQKNTKPNK
jgi:hypothetical protein